MGAVVVDCEISDHGKSVRTASLPALAAGAELAKHHGGGVVAVVVGSGV
ncbi:MAG: hypothetical protein JWM82_1797, partial [Myxococcales bacterium]|nr:hypothetical protein [Myxococcales bacterium]